MFWKKSDFFIGTFKGLENEITKPKKQTKKPQNLKKKKKKWRQEKQNEKLNCKFVPLITIRDSVLISRKHN